MRRRHIAAAFSRHDRRQRITREGIEGFLDTLRRLPIQIERREALWLWQAVLPVAREHRLSAYDAAYLELAKREGVHLAACGRSSFDRSLTRAVL